MEINNPVRGYRRKYLPPDISSETIERVEHYCLLNKQYWFSLCPHHFQNKGRRRIKLGIYRLLIQDILHRLIGFTDK
jgi:hypothetical protein